MDRKKKIEPKPFKKEEVEKIMEDVDRKLEEFIKSGNYKDVLIMMGNLGKYSLTNQIYILLQKPDAVTANGMSVNYNLKFSAFIALRITSPQPSFFFLFPFKAALWLRVPVRPEGDVCH